MQKTVIINRGIPASGKSTIAQEIISTLQQNDISAIAHSTDSYFMAEDIYRFDNDKLREYHLKNQDSFKASLRDAIEVVICDNTNIEPWEAKPYYDMAKEHDYKVILIDFQPRDMEHHLRSQTNAGYQRNIPIAILRDMEERYQNYRELTEKSSYPTSRKHPKKEYDEETKRVERHDEASEPFYYDTLLQIASNDYHKIKNIIGNMILKKIRDYSLNEISLIPSHYKTIMKEFQKRPDKTLTAYDLKDVLGKSTKQIKRYMDELQSEFHNIIEVKIGHKKGYKLIDSFDIFVEAFDRLEDVDELLYLAQESSPELFKKLEYQNSKNNDLYLFRNSIFESVENRDIFNKLKKAIKANEYRKIKFFDDDTIYEVKCIKLVFVDNNWYLAYVDSDDILQLGRVSFIVEVKYATKNTYQKNSIKKHLNLLEKNLQNAMTLFDEEPQVATVHATAAIAKYFQKDMKKFFHTQEFKEQCADGSIIFTIKYTQPLEILPFIQKWLPDLIILEPQELRDVYIQKLKKTLQNQKGTE